MIWHWLKVRLRILKISLRPNSREFSPRARSESQDNGLADGRCMMLTVTENAKRHLKNLLVKNTSDPSLGIRLRVGRGMLLGVLLDRKADDDHVVEHEGTKVLMVGPELFSLVHGTVLDTEKSGPVESLVITRSESQPGKKARDNLCVVR
jgi:Fe-S cluster assembly iron-binding protein IscA